MLKGQEEFDDLVDAYDGNRYEACMYVAKESRRRSNVCGHSLLESKSITWVLTGKKPKFPDEDKRILSSAYNSPLDLLNYVNDDEIRKCVQLSLKQSKTFKHLTYAYKKSMDDSRRVRVRILSNIIWYKLQEEAK